MRNKKWLIVIRNILIMFLAFEIILGIGILIVDPMFSHKEDIVDFLRLTFFNTWSFFYQSFIDVYILFGGNLLIDLILFIKLCRNPLIEHPYRLSILYFIVRFIVGLFSAYSGNYCMCYIGSQMKVIAITGAFINILYIIFCIAGIIFCKKLKSQSAIEKE